jgi:menaquinone-dependent protoporphyrinogen IX oxidase
MRLEGSLVVSGLLVEQDANPVKGGIMRTRVVYQSTTGNTKKVAEAIAHAVGCTAEPVSAATIIEPVDMLFLGASIHAKDVDATLVKHVTVFGTGFDESRDKAVGIMKDLLARRGIAVTDKCYFCLGKFVLFNRHHPDTQDLTGAEEFARGVLAG